MLASGIAQGRRGAGIPGGEGGDPQVDVVRLHDVEVGVIGDAGVADQLHDPGQRQARVLGRAQQCVESARHEGMAIDLVFHHPPGAASPRSMLLGRYALDVGASRRATEDQEPFWLAHWRTMSRTESIPATSLPSSTTRWRKPPRIMASAACASVQVGVA